MTIPEQADIVKRLRDWEDYEPAKMFGGEILKDTKEAADEIERLRSLVGVERAALPPLPPPRTAGQEWREPEGWQLVPKELTEDMAAEIECSDGTDEGWQRALAACPPLPAPPVAEPIVAEKSQVK